MSETYSSLERHARKPTEPAPAKPSGQSTGSAVSRLKPSKP
jgi:hypothetical protein